MTINDIDEKIKKDIFTQDYSPKITIEGVKLVKIANHVGEDSSFLEILRLDNEGNSSLFDNFHLAQVNHTQLYVNSVKAWHLHLKQSEIWFPIPGSVILVGLLDLRKDSPTKGHTQRIVFSESNCGLLYIPNGVAHGSANLSSNMADMIYFVDQQFNSKDPDEYRLHWDFLGKEFWQPVRD